MEGIRLRLRKYYIRATAAVRRKKLKHTDFTILSNNCWGGIVYESYGLPKQSPTVGMYFMAEEYLRFLQNPEYYLKHCTLEFVDPEQARHRDFYARDSSFGSYPIGRLGDVEIAMLHFHSQQEAREKWERRCARVNMDRLLVKMNDQNGCTAEQARQFGALPFENKLFFTVKDYDAGPCTVRLGGGGDAVAASREPFGAARRCNVDRVINGL